MTEAKEKGCKGTGMGETDRENYNQGQIQIERKKRKRKKYISEKERRNIKGIGRYRDWRDRDREHHNQR